MKGFLIAIILFFGLIGYVPALCQDQNDSLALARETSIAYDFFLSNPDSSISLANRALTSALERNNLYYEGYSYFVLAKAHWAKANYRLSTEFGFKALKIFENSSYTHMWGETMLSLARTLIDLKNLDQADVFLRRAMEIAITHSNDSLKADVFRERSMLLLEKMEYDSALYFADSGLALYEASYDTLNASILYGRKGRIYLALKDYQNSMTFNKKGILMDSLVGNRRALGTSFFQAAQNEYYVGNTKQSIRYLIRSIALSKEIGNLSTLIKAYSFLSEIYFSQGKTGEAFKQIKIVNQLKDSLYSTERNGQIQEMQSIYELGNKENTIRLLQHENELKLQQVKSQRSFTLFLLAVMFLLTLLIFVLWRLRVLQKRANDFLAVKNKAIEQQREEMQTQAENLQQLNNLKSKLFSVISHDLRGPINNLQALLELLTTRNMRPEEFYSISDKLKANLNVTQRTLENLLNWSLSQMEGIRTEQSRIEIKTLIDETCRLMDEVAQRKNITIENTTLSVIYVLGDLNQVQLILRNLIHNAIKFSKTDSKILVSASLDQSMCYIRVKDFGIGMSSEETEVILGSQEYFTKAGTLQEKGTGLGLLLCKEFIKRNGGTLGIQSHPGQWTEVSFSLPLA